MEDENDPKDRHSKNLKGESELGTFSEHECSFHNIALFFVPLQSVMLRRSNHTKNETLDK